MKHWTEKFFVRNPELWLHFLDRGWKRNKFTVRAVHNILKQQGIMQGNLLDVGCGNGRISIPMARRGYQVTGLDISPLYITDARKRAARNRLKVNFMCGDLRKLGRLVRRKFDAVVSIWTSIGYYDKRTDQRLFRDVAQHLRSNGLFLIFNTMSQEFLLNHYCSSLFNETDKYVVIHKDNRFDRYHSINTEKWVFYEKKGKDLVYVDETEIRLRIYSLAEIVEMAEAVGLEFVEAYDDLRDLKPARPDSAINIVLRKK